MVIKSNVYTAALWVGLTNVYRMPLKQHGNCNVSCLKLERAVHAMTYRTLPMAYGAARLSATALKLCIIFQTGFVTENRAQGINAVKLILVVKESALYCEFTLELSGFWECRNILPQNWNARSLSKWVQYPCTADNSSDDNKWWRTHRMVEESTVMAYHLWKQQNNALNFKNYPVVISKPNIWTAILKTLQQNKILANFKAKCWSHIDPLLVWVRENESMWSDYVDGNMEFTDTLSLLARTVESALHPSPQPQKK